MNANMMNANYEFLQALKYPHSLGSVYNSGLKVRMLNQKSTTLDASTSSI